MSLQFKQQKFANVCWTVADVQSLAPKMSDEAAEEWLSENAGRIQDRLTELGWETISIMLSMDGVDCSDKEAGMSLAMQVRLYPIRYPIPIHWTSFGRPA